MPIFNIIGINNSVSVPGLFDRFQRVPKNEKNKVGIVIAISTENEKGKNRLEKDFLSALTNLLEVDGLGTRLNIIQYPEKISVKIKNQDDAHKYLTASKAHIIFYGSIVERNSNGENSYLIRLKGTVVHDLVEEGVRKKLIEDFSASLPGKLQFPEKLEIQGFDVTGELVAYCAKFVVGCAAMISDDYLLAYNLFCDVKEKLEVLAPERILTNSTFSEIYKRNNSRLLKVSLRLGHLYYLQYAFERDKNVLLETKKFLSKIDEIDPDNYEAKLGWSMIHFFEKDIEKAIEILKKANGGRNSMWHYNLGFLYAWKGDVPNALEQYKKAFHGEIDPMSINDLEIFMSEQITANQGNVPVLIFFRGVLNFKLRDDYKLAKEDFENFLGKDDSGNYPELVVLAKKYLESN